MISKHFLLIFTVNFIALFLMFNLFPVSTPSKSNVQVLSPISHKQTVLSVQASEPEITVIPTPTLILPSPVPTEVSTSNISNRKTTLKSSYKIAYFGDSMIDTGGERREYDEHSLKAKYPNTDFQLYNYGKGSQTAAMGLALFHQPLQYKDRAFPSVDELKPDIIIIGSFAYNPYDPPSPTQHWVDLTKIVEEAKKITPNVYILAEIAPLRATFGRGPAGVNYETSTAITHSQTIIDQLNGAVGLAKALNVGLIDAFHPSIVSADSGGNPAYVNPGDGIHPSAAGFEFMANILAKTIKF